MRLSENTRFSVTLAMQVAILGVACRGGYALAEMNTKLDLLWKEAGHAAVSPAPAPAETLYVIRTIPCATSP